MTVLVSASAVIIFVLAATKAGRIIDAATQHFMLYYAGVLALIALTGAVLVSLLATDRIIMTPGHRVMAQAVHRAFAFGAVTFLIIHIVTEILAQRSHVIDAFIPFLSPYRTFYIGLGTIASDLIVLLVVTGILRNRFAAHGKAWRWRAIHYTSYVAFVFGVLHGLLGGRYAKPYVDWSYGFAIGITGLGLAIRFLAISVRPKASLSPSVVADGARASGSSPLHAAALSMAQAQFGGTVQALSAGLGGRDAATGMPGTGTWAALPTPGWSPSSGPLPALSPAPAYAAPPSSSGAYRDLGFLPLGAPPYGDDVPGAMQGPPYVAADQPTPAVPAGPAGPAGAARQPLYEPGYDGPPRYAGAPRGHGDVPQDQLSSYPYGPRGHQPQPAARYPDDDAGRAGPDGTWPGRAAESPRPRAAIPPSPRRENPGTGPMPRLATGPVSHPGTGPIPRASNGQPPRSGTGPMPSAGMGPMPSANPGPMPRLGTGPMPRLDTTPMPRPDTGPIRRAGNGRPPRDGTGLMPRAATGPMPRAGSAPRADPGPVPRLGTGPAPREDAGPMPRSGTRPMPSVGSGPLSRPDVGPPPRAGTGPMSRPGQSMPPVGPGAEPRTGPLPKAATRPSHRANPDDPRYREMPGPTGGDEWE